MTQASLAIAPSNPKRLFLPLSELRIRQNSIVLRTRVIRVAFVETDSRPTTRIASGDLGDIQFDPKNADVLYGCKRCYLALDRRRKDMDSLSAARRAVMTIRISG